MSLGWDVSQNACGWVVDAVVSTVAAIQKAWDSLEAGLKQWIIYGVAFAVSFILLVGPKSRLISSHQTNQE